MKKSLFVVMGMLGFFGLYAQKYGFINSAEILEAMPETKTLNTRMEEISKAMDAEIKNKGEAFQAESRAFSTRINTSNMSKAEYDKEVARLEALQKELSDLESERAKTLDAKQTELMKPIYDKLNTAVREVARERGAAAVFFSDVFAFAEDTVNFTEAVKAKLGIR